MVTGGCSGLGKATAARLREEGITVITVDISPEADHVLDVSDADAVRSLADQIGPVDILVNSAGGGAAITLLWETSDEDWNHIMAINATGTFHFCRAFVPGMIERGWGRIINIASIAGKEGNVRGSAYSAAKAAVIGLTKSLGKELATTGVLVNAIAPAVIATEGVMEKMDPTERDVLAAKIPMQRMGRPEEVAELIAWLASDRVSFSTGFTYDISGGRATY